MPGRERQLRIAFLAGTLAQGGAEKQMAYMADALQRTGTSVAVFNLTPDGFYDSWLRGRAVHTRFLGRFSNPVIRVGALLRALTDYRPHVIQAGHTYMNAYAALMSALGGWISVGAVRTNVANLRTLHNKWIVRLLMSTTALITNSEETRSGLISSGLARAERIHVVPNAVQTSETGEALARKRRCDDGNVRALFLGRLIGSKRVDRFLRALALARRAVPQLVGVIAGSGTDREMAERLARELGLDRGEVVFLGHSENAQDVLASADFLAFTSDDMEGSPNSILEAMAAGLPVVTTACGNVASLIEDGETGFLCDFDVDSLADKMVTLVRHPELRTSMGVAGWQRAADHFGTSHLGGRLLDVYRAAASAEQRHSICELLEHT